MLYNEDYNFPTKNVFFSTFFHPFHIPLASWVRFVLFKIPFPFFFSITHNFCDICKFVLCPFYTLLLRYVNVYVEQMHNISFTDSSVFLEVNIEVNLHPIFSPPTPFLRFLIHRPPKNQCWPSKPMLAVLYYVSTTISMFSSHIFLFKPPCAMIFLSSALPTSHMQHTLPSFHLLSNIS